MRNTVTRAVSDRQVKDETDVIPVLNKELLPLVREFRDALNTEAQDTRTLSTAATATFTSIWTSDAIPTNRAWHVWAKVTGFATAGPAQQCSYVREALFSNVAGTVTQVGVTAAPTTFETAAAADVQFLVSGQTVALQVKDDGVSTFNWKATVRIYQTEEV